jgi:hypothetical protein
MKNKAHLLLAALLMTLPALPIVILGLVAWHDPRDRYWALVYLVWGMVFAALSSVAAGWVIRRARAAHCGLTQKALGLAGIAAWGLSFPALVVINLTPLCLGQDNGDGRNDVLMCLLLAVVWFAFMSLPVAGGIAVATKPASKAARGGDAEAVCRSGLNEPSRPSAGGNRGSAACLGLSGASSRQAGQEKLSGVVQVPIEPLQFAGEWGDDRGLHSARELATHLQGGGGGGQGLRVWRRLSHRAMQDPPHSKQNDRSEGGCQRRAQERQLTPCSGGPVTRPNGLHDRAMKRGKHLGLWGWLPQGTVQRHHVLFKAAQLFRVACLPPQTG